MAERTIGLRLELNGFRGVVTSIKELETEIRKAKEDLAELEIGGDLFRQLTGEISRAEGQLMKLQDASKGIGLEKQLEGYGKLAGGITSSFAAAQAAVQLFGVESESVSKAAAQAQNILTLALSARGIQEVGVGATIVARTIAEKAATAATTASNTALKALYTTIAANPIGALVAALGLLVTAVIAFNSEAEQTIDVQKELGKVTSDEAVKLEIYTSVLKDANSTNEQRKQAIDELKKTYPGFNALIDEENRLTEDGIKWVDLKIKSLIKEAQAKLLVQKIAENNNKLLEIENRTVEESINWYDKAEGYVAKLFSAYGDLGQQMVELTAAERNNKEEKNKLTAENDKLQDALKGILGTQENLDTQMGDTNKKMKKQADLEKDLSKNTTDANKATAKQIELEKQLQAQLDATDKEWNATLKTIQDLVKTTQVEAPEPQILKNLKAIVDARNALEEKTLSDVFKQLGFTLNQTSEGLIKVSDNVGVVKDRFGQAFDNYREQLVNGVTLPTEEFRKVINSIVGEATKFAQYGFFNQEALDTIKLITDQYAQFNKLIQTTPDVKKIFNDEVLQKFYESTKEILISTGDITLEYDNVTKKFQEVRLSSRNINFEYEKQANILASLKKQLVDYYTSILVKDGVLQESAIKTANLTDDQIVKLVDASKKGIETLKVTINEIATTQVEGVKTLVTTIATEENNIRKYFKEVTDLVKEGNLDAADAIKNAILSNTDLLIKETQKVNGIVLNNKKTARQNLESFETQMAKKGIDLTKFTEEEKLRLVKAYLDKQVAATKEAEDEKRAEQKITLDDVQKGLQVISQTLTDVASIAAQAFQLQLDKLTYEYEKDMSMIVGDTEEANAKRIELEKIYQAEKRKIEKQAQLTALKFTMAQAVAQGAQAVINALATIPPPANAIVAGIQAAVTAAQVAVIAQQIAFVQSQTMRRGGVMRMAAGGLAQGPSHENGGIYAGGGYTIEGNEAIINRQSTLQYAPLLNQINQSGGGRPIMVSSPMDSRIMEAIAKQKTEPIRAYVLEADITRSQTINRRLEQLASF